MQHLKRWEYLLTTGVLLGLLTGCMGLDQVPRAERDPIYGLGQSAARLIAEQPWSPPLAQQVLLLAPPKVDAMLDTQPGALNEALTRALLSLQDGPQVLNWNNDHSGIASHQWRLETLLEASGIPLKLSDRTLQSYQLTLTLVRSTGVERNEIRTLTLNGAFDQAALEALARTRTAP